MNGAEKTSKQLLEEVSTLQNRIQHRENLKDAKSSSTENQFYSVVESAQDAIISANDRGNIVYWNKGAEKVFGYTKYEILGNPLTQIIPRNLRKTYLEGFERSLSEAKSKLFGKIVELTGLRKNGEEFPLEITLATWKFEEERFFTGIIRDIFEKKQTMMRLSLFKQLLDNSSDAFFIIDPESGTVLDLNESACENLGYERAELLEMTVMDIDTVISTIRKWKKHVNDIRKKGYLLVESEFNRNDGSLFPVEINIKFVSLDEKDYLVAVARDITERRKSEEMLRKSRELYTLLVNNANDGIYITSPEYLEFINPAFERFSGYEFDEVCNTEFDILELIHPDDRDLIRKRTDDRKAGKKISSRYEFRFVTKSGNTKYVEVNTVPLPGEKGKVLGMLRDMTERKEAEFALLESEKKYRQIIEEAGDIVYTTDVKGYFTFANTIAERVTGYSMEEIIGKRFLDLIAPESREEAGIFYLKQIEEQIESTYYEYPLLTKKGDRLWLGQNVQLIKQNGEIIGVQAVARDISARRRAENILKESEERLKIMYDFAPDGYYINDLTGTFLDGNRAAEKLLGYKKEELIGKNFLKLKLLRVRDIPRAAKLLVRGALGEPTGPDEFTLNRKDGTKITLEIRTFPVTIDGKKVILGDARDITERKKTEIKLLETTQYLATILFNLPVGVAILEGPEFRYFRINERLAELNGLPVEDHIGKPLVEVLPDAEKNLLPELREIMRNGKAILDREFTIALPQNPGKPLHLMDYLFPILGENGKPRGVGAVVLDITLRKEAEEEIRLAHDELEEKVEERTRALNIVNKSLKREIEEHLLAKNELIRSEQRLKTLMEKMPEAVGVASEGKIVFTNKANADIFGYQKEELIGKPVIDFLHPDDRERAGKRIGELMAGGEEQYAQYKMIRKDGADFPGEIYSRKFQFEGKPALLSVIRDITERVTAEKKLRDTMAQLTVILDFQPVVTYTSKTEGDYALTYVTNNVFELTGYKPEEFTSKSSFWVDNLHAEDAERALENLSNLREKEISSHEYRWRISDGSFIWIYESMRLIRGKDGSDDHIVGMWQDITERKKINKELKESLSILKSTMDATYDGIFVVDNSMRPTYYNQKFMDIMGFTNDFISQSNFEARMKSVANLFKNPEQFRSRIEYFKNNPNEEGVDLIEFNDGRVFERNSMPRIIDGNVVGRIWSFKDITNAKNEEQKRLLIEQRLERAQRMEVLGVLAGGVAHDLNNILGPMVAYPDLIAAELSENNPILEDLKVIKESAIGAAEVVSDLLTLARRGNYKMQTLSLNDVIQKHLNSLAHQGIQALYADVVLKTSLSSRLKKLNGSSAHLSKVVMNLINNAYESMPHGGNLSIRTLNKKMKSRSLFYDQIPEGEYAVLEINDTGFGMKEEEMSKIFEPFFSKKEMGRSGSGLGLSVVWGVVKDHAGYIDVYSEEGVSTKFTIYFPVTEQGKIVSEKPTQILKGTETIIVIDDEEKQREIAKRTLSSLGYTVICFKNGKEGIDYLKNNDADLLILDMVMESEYTGLEIYRNILKIKPNLKSIIVSGFSETKHVKEAINLGVKTYIKKPFTVDNLGKIVRETLDS